jgi:GNAT superfamily N-acetyltransferase
MASQLDITISPVTDESDFPALINIEDRAYASCPMYQLIFLAVRNNPAAKSASIESRIMLRKREWSRQPNMRYFKVSTSTGQIVGLAVWDVSASPWGEPDPEPPNPVHYPSGANIHLCNHYFLTMNALSAAVMSPLKTHWCLENLVVDPPFQRMGVGRKLLMHMLEKADRRGVECWTDASPIGLKLYRSLGWIDIGATEYNLEDWGGKKGAVHKVVGMVRKPALAKDNEKTGELQ